MKKGNELVKVAVNVISPLADPRAAAPQLQAITWPRTRASLPQQFTALPGIYRQGGGGESMKKVFEKKRERARELYTQGNAAAPAHYVQRVSGWRGEKTRRLVVFNLLSIDRKCNE